MPGVSGTKDNVHSGGGNVTGSKPPPSGSSVTSFADFVSAPGRGRRFRHNNNGSISGGGSISGTPKSAFFPHTPSQLSKSTHDSLGVANGAGTGTGEEAEEVLFDSDELGGGVSYSSRGGTRTGTEESASGSEDGEREKARGSVGRSASSSGRRTPGQQDTPREFGKDR